MFGRIKIDLTTKEGIESLEKITNYKTQFKIIKKSPEVILYASKYWHKNDNFKKLLLESLIRKPELITQFKGKNGLIAGPAEIKVAVLQDPMVIGKMNKEMQDTITPELFVQAFIKNPLILTFKDLKCLKHRYKCTGKVKENGELVEKEITTTLRNECLKAIRLSENVSSYHEGFDDFALQIAKGLKNSQNFQGKKYSAELLSNFATLMNAMIKKNNQKLRACSVDAWKVNNGKPMYKAIRSSAKKDSQLEGLITDMPTKLLDEKIVKRLIIAAVKTNPEFYLKLEEYGFKDYVNDNTVKYHVYKSLKRHGMLKKVDKFLDEKDIVKSKNRLAGYAKRVKRPKNPQLPAVVEEEVK